MSSSSSAPATGPAILAQVLELKTTVELLIERIEDIAAASAARNELIDRFVDPAMDLQGTLKQIIQSQQRLKEAVENAERTTKNEHTTTRSAVALHMGAEGLERDLERERGG